MLFLRCPFCKSPTKFRSPENATYVFNGDPVCARPVCRERLIELSPPPLAVQTYNFAGGP